jgi:hypothetical protein
MLIRVQQDTMVWKELELRRGRKMDGVRRGGV